MFISLNKESSRAVRELSHKIGISKRHVVRLAISDMSSYFLDSPHQYVVFEKDEWDRTLASIKADMKRGRGGKKCSIISTKT